MKAERILIFIALALFAAAFLTINPHPWVFIAAAIILYAISILIKKRTVASYLDQHH